MNELTSIALLTAFGAGIISFLSPCVLPLVPAYMSYVTGQSLAPAGAAPLARAAAGVGPEVGVGPKTQEPAQSHQDRAGSLAIPVHP